MKKTIYLKLSLLLNNLIDVKDFYTLENIAECLKGKIV